MIGGSGIDTMFAGAGSGTLTGGANDDIFAFFNSATEGTNQRITDFGTGNDIVIFSGYSSVDSASSLVNNATVSGSGVIVGLSDGTTVTFSNLTAASQLNGKILYAPGP
jgi:Ca2+-binding RTX toxin-like protein